MGVSIDETVREEDINDLFQVFQVDITAEQVGWNIARFSRGISKNPAYLHFRRIPIQFQASI